MILTRGYLFSPLLSNFIIKHKIMGLDMYLVKKTYIGNKYRKKDKIVKVVIPQNQEEVTFPTGLIKNERIRETIEDVGYWRKANHIHKWFVDNVQEGNDDCKEYYVSRDNLRKLLEVVEQVLANNKLSSELLPTEEGFFFGGTEYDGDYFGDLEDTKKILEEVLKEEDGDFYYKSSW